MKKIFISLLALGCLVACTPKKTAYEQYTELYNNVGTQLETVEDRAVRDSIIEDFVAQGYTLLMENIEDITSDSIVLAHFYMLTPEQKAELFAAIPAERLEMPTLQPIHQEYLIELKTSAGNPYIEISSLKADGTALALSELVGKTDYVLVDFWASWCGPCKGEIPNLIELQSKFGGEKFTVLGVNVWDEEAKFKAALVEEGITYPQIYSPRDNKDNATELYGIQGIPQIILFGPDGKIIQRDLRGQAMKDLVEEKMK